MTARISWIALFLTISSIAAPHAFAGRTAGGFAAGQFSIQSRPLFMQSHPAFVGPRVFAVRPVVPHRSAFFFERRVIIERSFFGSPFAAPPFVTVPPAFAAPSVVIVRPFP